MMRVKDLRHWGRETAEKLEEFERRETSGKGAGVGERMNK